MLKGTEIFALHKSTLIRLMLRKVHHALQVHEPCGAKNKRGKNNGDGPTFLARPVSVKQRHMRKLRKS
jgi:hypothetical protein